MMKPYLMFLTMSMLFAHVAASPQYEAQMPSILAGIASTNALMRLGTTNQIAQLMASVTNRSELATCSLLMAKVRTECVDISGSGSFYDPLSYADVTNHCWFVIHDGNVDFDAWHPYGAVFLLAKPLSMDGQHAVIFNVATNALGNASSRDAISIETNVWTTLFGSETMQIEPMRNSLKALAAISLKLSDSTANIYAYTNGLPTSIVDSIRGVIAGAGE